MAIKASYVSDSRFLRKDLTTELGAGFRLDDVNDISLSNTVKREFLNDVQRGDVKEANANAYISETLTLSDEWSVNAALRFDYFNFRYDNRLDNTNKSTGKVNRQSQAKYQLSAE